MKNKNKFANNNDSLNPNQKMENCTRREEGEQTEKKCEARAKHINSR